jgi:hypothetical protein
MEIVETAMTKERCILMECRYAKDKEMFWRYSFVLLTLAVVTYRGVY